MRGLEAREKKQTGIKGKEKLYEIFFTVYQHFVGCVKRNYILNCKDNSLRVNIALTIFLGKKMSLFT